MFPGPAKEASKELKKLGVENIGCSSGGAEFRPEGFGRDRVPDEERPRRRERGKYLAAEKLYTQASKLDPADPTPMRYLAELYRHHIGDWDKAKVEFQQDPRYAG